MKTSVISVVAPVYNESQNIPLFYAEIEKVADKLDYAIELIFVDDGSLDSSARTVESLKPHTDVEVRLIELSRNFGKEIATSAGIEAATGEAVVIIDADLQHPVALIPEFVTKWQEGNEVVIGVRATEGHHGGLKKLGSLIFYKIMNYISETKIVPHSTDFRLIDRIVADAFKSFTERQRITRGLIDWMGFHRGYVYFDAGKRLHGTPAYSMRKLTRLALNSFTSYSLFPLRLAGYIGVIFMIIFGIAGVFTYVEMFVLNDPMQLAITGTAMLGMLMLFTIGIVLACLGLIALYIANIHGEVINRPLYVVRRTKKV